MKEKFHQYYRKSEEEISLLWENSIIVFDTNILLDMYRFPDKERDEFMQVLRFFKDRIWLPYQVASEYHEELITVIMDPYKTCQKEKEAIKTFRNTLISLTQPQSNIRIKMALKENTINTINQSLNCLEEELQQIMEKSFQRLTDCKIPNDIAELFEGKIGNGFTKNELSEIYENAEKRYTQRIPPGYDDEKKTGDRKYGDFVIWQELIKYAKEAKKSIIFISNDCKKDWIREIHSRKIGPHIELLEEFKRETNGQDILIYTTKRFLEYSQKIMGKGIKDESIKIIDSVAFDNEYQSTAYNLQDIYEAISEPYNRAKQNWETTQELIDKITPHLPDSWQKIIEKQDTLYKSLYPDWQRKK